MASDGPGYKYQTLCLAAVREWDCMDRDIHVRQRSRLPISGPVPRCSSRKILRGPGSPCPPAVPTAHFGGCTSHRYGN